MWLRVIGAGFGVAVAAQSVAANAADCYSDGSFRWENDTQSIRILSKKNELRYTWLVKKREFVVEGEIVDTNTTDLSLTTDATKTWQKNLRYFNSDKGKRENQVIVYYQEGITKNTCTFTIQTKKDSQDFAARAKKVVCTDEDAVVDCTRQYKAGSNNGRFDFTITLGRPTRESAAK